MEDFKYLGLKYITIVSVWDALPKIHAYTADLVREGRIYLYHVDSTITAVDTVLQQLRQPSFPYQVRLRLDSEIAQQDPIIGYTAIVTYPTKHLELILMFAYIIKVLDQYLQITDVLSNGTDLAVGNRDNRDELVAAFFDARRPIRYQLIRNYNIHQFRYTKQGWHVPYDHPSLLTLKGLRRRHVPLAVLQAFYVHSSQLGTVPIQTLSVLLEQYLRVNAQSIQGVVQPLTCQLQDWPAHRTEYICYTKTASTGLAHHPISKTVYIEQRLFGLDQEYLNKGRTTLLVGGLHLQCIAIQSEPESGSFTLACRLRIGKANETPQLNGPVPIPRNWISSPAGQAPCAVRFYCYNHFYTGYNQIIDPVISDGYVDPSVFQALDQYYRLPTLGYIHYDPALTANSDRPVFVVIKLEEPANSSLSLFSS
jgi:hypothetical protein